jgi:hypothetical protein
VAPLEREVVRAARAMLEREIPGSIWFKIHGGPHQPAGLPDLVGSVDGHFVGIEFKRAAGLEPTPRQMMQLAKLQEAGARVGVAFTPEQAVSIALGNGPRLPTIRELAAAYAQLTLPYTDAND